MSTPNRNKGLGDIGKIMFRRTLSISCNWKILLNSAYGQFQVSHGLSSRGETFHRVRSAKIPQTTNFCLFQRHFFAFSCPISSRPGYLSWTFVQFYTQTDCRDLHMRSKSGNFYATEIEKLPFIRCFAAKSISNSCWQVLVGHEHLTGWIISAKKKKENWPPKVYRILTLVKMFPNFITDVIQTWTNEKTTWHLPLYLTVVTRISSKGDKQCTTNQLLYL